MPSQTMRGGVSFSSKLAASSITATLNPWRVRMSSMRPVMSLVPVWVA